MNGTNLFKIALRALANNKLRAFLTMLGIIIGVASVITKMCIRDRPMTTPMIPPVILIRMASIRNCERISTPRAPTDIRLSLIHI